MMALNADGSEFYTVTPELEIRRYSTFYTTSNGYELLETFERPESIDHFSPLHSINILKFDHYHDRLYWLVFGRNDVLCDPGSFHYKERYFAIFSINTAGDLEEMFVEQMKASDDYANANISDVEFNHTNDFFYLTKLGKMEIWEIVSNTAEFRDHIIIDPSFYTNHYKFGEMIYINEGQNNSIHKIIALPYRYRLLLAS